MIDPWKHRLDGIDERIIKGEEDRRLMKLQLDDLYRARNAIFNEWEAYKEGLRRERAAAFEREMKNA